MESASYGIYALVVFVSEISPVRFLIRQQLVRNASVNSSCAQPPRATAGHLPALSVPGVGHLQILCCPGAGHLPTPWPIFPSF